MSQSSAACLPVRITCRTFSADGAVIKRSFTKSPSCVSEAMLDSNRWWKRGCPAGVSGTNNRCAFSVVPSQHLGGGQRRRLGFDPRQRLTHGGQGRFGLDVELNAVEGQQVGEA
jgi:hypothetical protein